MPPAAVIGIAAASAAAKGYAAKRAGEKRNRYLQGAAGQFDPQNQQQWMQQMDPNLMAAMGMGGQSTGAWGNNLANIAQNPGYIDPKLMNLPMQLSALKQQQDLTAAQGKLGKSGMRGGLSSAYALANQAGRTMRDVNTQQQYSLWREQQRRADMQMIQQMYQQLMGQSQAAAGGKANMLGQQQAPMSMAGILGNTMQAGLGAYGQMGGGMGGGGGAAPQSLMPWQGATGPQIAGSTNQWWNSAPQAPMAPSSGWGSLPQGGDFVNDLWQNSGYQ